jgi:tRNA(adenine34) deaminase
MVHHKLINGVDNLDINNAHGFLMTRALEQAEKALEAGEFPVGCVIADGDEILSMSSRIDSRNTAGGETKHAEITALEKLERFFPERDRKNMVLYSTMEPCLMCFGAIIISGIKNIVFAYEDVMGGGTSCRLDALPPLYRDSGISVVSGVMRSESLSVFRRFFLNPDNTYLRGTLLEQYTVSAV